MGIRNIPNSFEDAADFQKEYEENHMRFAETNVEIADATMELLCSKIPFPSLHKKFIHPVVHALCPPLLRRAMGFPDVSPYFSGFIEILLHLHSFVVKYFVLPKNVLVTRTGVTDEEYEATLKSENGERKLYTKFDQYDCTYKDGYIIEHLGPAQFCPVLRKNMKDE